jgi:hypothetical protein
MLILFLFFVLLLLLLFTPRIENFYEFDTPEKITIHNLFQLSDAHLNQAFDERINTPQYKSRCK